MPQQNLTVLLSVDSGSAIAKYLRVKHGATDGQVDIAGDEACIGTNQTTAYAAGEPIIVADIRGPGTRIFVASAAIAVGDAVTSAAGGKVASGALGAEDYGIAITAATGDGGLIEAYPA